MKTIDDLLREHPFFEDVDSATVARAWATAALAAARAASLLATASRSLAVSSWASNWPFFTRSFSSTRIAGTSICCVAS